MFDSFTLTTLVGLTAGTLTTLAFMPQAIKAWRTSSTRDLSLPTFLMLCTGVILWLVYGLLLRDLPLIVANGITFLFAAVILWVKMRHG